MWKATVTTAPDTSSRRVGRHGMKEDLWRLVVTSIGVQSWRSGWRSPETSECPNHAGTLRDCAVREAPAASGRKVPFKEDAAIPRHVMRTNSTNQTRVQSTRSGISGELFKTRLRPRPRYPWLKPPCPPRMSMSPTMTAPTAVAHSRAVPWPT